MDAALEVFREIGFIVAVGIAAGAIVRVAWCCVGPSIGSNDGRCGGGPPRQRPPRCAWFDL